MKKRRNFCCGFSPRKSDVSQDIVAPVSNHKGVRIFDILNKVDDENDNISEDSDNGKMKKKKKRSAEKGLSFSPAAPISPLSRCLALFRPAPGYSSRSYCGKNSSPGGKGGEFGCDGQEIKVLEKSVKKSVSRKLDFSSNEVAPRTVSDKQNSRKSHESDGAAEFENNHNNVIDNRKIHSSEEAGIQTTKDEVDRCKLKASSKMFNSSRKGESLIFPAWIVPELPSNVVSSSTKKSRRKFPGYLRPRRTKSSKRPGRMVSRSLFLCHGMIPEDRASRAESKMADSVLGIRYSEKLFKQADSAEYMASLRDCNPLLSKDNREKDWQEQEESRCFPKKRKAACGLPLLPSRDALNRDTFRFPGAAKPWEELLFNFGLGFGVVFMVTSSKNEIDKLRELLKQTESLVKDLKQEVDGRDLCNDSSQMVDPGKSSILEHQEHKNGAKKDRKGEMVFENQSSSRSLAGGFSSQECDGSAHSVITMESTQRKSGMAQLEAELEAELERMQLDLIAGSSSHRRRLSGSEMTEDIVLDIVHGDLNDGGILQKKRNPEQADVHGAYYGVCPIELEKRLHQLLQKRQEERIAELEADLKSAEKKLLDKERELFLWKECVQQLSGQSLGATTFPGEESIASTSTGGESSRSLFMPSSCHQGDPIQEMNKLKDSEALNYCSKTANCLPRMKYGSPGPLDMKVERSPNAYSLVKDWDYLMRPQNSGGKAISATYSEADEISTVAWKAYEKFEGTEEKESCLLYMGRKAAHLKHAQNYSTARSLVTDTNPSESNALQCRKVFSPLSVSNTPVGGFNGNINSQITHQQILHSSLQRETCSEGDGEIRSPVQNKIRHWEALSRGESSSRQSCDLDNQAPSPKSVGSLPSVLVKGNASCADYNQEEIINCSWETSSNRVIKERSMFSSNEQDAVLDKIEAFSYDKLDCLDCNDAV